MDDLQILETPTAIEVYISGLSKEQLLDSALYSWRNNLTNIYTAVINKLLPGSLLARAGDIKCVIITEFIKSNFHKHSLLAGLLEDSTMDEIAVCTEDIEFILVTNIICYTDNTNLLDTVNLLQYRKFLRYYGFHYLIKIIEKRIFTANIPTFNEQIDDNMEKLVIQRYPEKFTLAAFYKKMKKLKYP